MKIKKVIEFLEEKLPFPPGVEKDSRIEFGDPNQELTGTGVTWSATSSLIEKAMEKGLNFIITHEMLFWPPYTGIWFEGEKMLTSVPQNLRKIKLLARGNLCIYMTHKNWDIAPEWGMIDAFPRVLGLKREIARGRFTRVHEVSPIKLKDLAEKVKKIMGLPGVRVAGNINKEVRRIGTAVGGLGQIYGVPEEFHRLGAEAIIFGEAVDYVYRASEELGIGVIETSHVASENYGIKGMADFLRGTFPNMKVEYLETQFPWKWI